jgi:WXG100 family type VII secretion target
MSNGNAFVTEVSTMTTASRHVDEVANAIARDLSDLDSKIQPITSSWRGAGSASYMALHTKFIEDANKLRQVLAEISLGIKQAGDRYQTQEDAVQSQMARTMSALS